MGPGGWRAAWGGWARGSSPGTSVPTRGSSCSACSSCSAPSPSAETMIAFLDGLGYDRWILTALLTLPLLGAIVVWLHGVRRGPEGDDVASGRADLPRSITFAVLLL